MRKVILGLAVVTLAVATLRGQPEAGSRKPEAGSWEPEAGSWQPEAGS
jgi:hypothetical protein